MFLILYYFASACWHAHTMRAGLCLLCSGRISRASQRAWHTVGAQEAMAKGANTQRFPWFLAKPFVRGCQPSLILGLQLYIYEVISDGKVPRNSNWSLTDK